MMGRTERQSGGRWAIVAVAGVGVLLLAFPGLGPALKRLGETASGILLLVVIVLTALTSGLVLLLGWRWWVRARRAGVDVPMAHIVGMRLRRAGVRRILKAAVRARELNVPVDIDRLEVHALAGGSPLHCVEALGEARRRGMKADWGDVTGLDLAGRDVIALVRAGKDPRGLLGSARLGNGSRHPGVRPD